MLSDSGRWNNEKRIRAREVRRTLVGSYSNQHRTVTKQRSISDRWLRFLVSLVVCRMVNACNASKYVVFQNIQGEN